MKRKLHAGGESPSLTVVDSAVSHVNESHTLVPDVEPWIEAVDGNELGCQMAKLIERHCILPENAIVASVLWVLSSYEIDNFRVFPKFAVNSPQKRCGKTTFLETISALCNRALLSSNLTSAVLFRVIEEYQPTLIIDEMDTFIDGNESMRGIINSGHTKKLAYVLRCEGDSKARRVKSFSSWTPTILAKIGPFPDTIADRAIAIRLERKLKSDVTERVPVDLDDMCITLRRQCKRWCNDKRNQIRASSPNIPSVGNDRALDNWFPLLAVADLMGGKWPDRARIAMISIESDEGRNDVEDLSIMLLEDIRSICLENAWERNVSSTCLAALLNRMEERPWPTISSKGLSVHKLASMMQTYNLRTGSRRIPGDSKTKKGYSIENMHKVFKRYLPD